MQTLGHTPIFNYTEKFLPFQINSGDIEHNSFEPQDHEETLGEWAVPNAFSIYSSLGNGKRGKMDFRLVIHLPSSRWKIGW